MYCLKWSIFQVKLRISFFADDRTFMVLLALDLLPLQTGSAMGKSFFKFKQNINFYLFAVKLVSTLLTLGTHANRD